MPDDRPPDSPRSSAADLPTGAPAPAAAPAGPSRKKKAAKIGLYVLVATGLLVAATPFLLSTGWMNGVVRSWLKENVEREVEFASLDVSWTEGIRLTGVVVHDEVAGQPPVLVAPLVILRAPVLPLLARRLEVSEFVIEDAVVRLAERGESVNAKGVIKLRKSRRARRAEAAAKAEEESSEPLVLPEMNVPVQVRNLTLVLADEKGNEARRPGISFTGRLATRDGPTTFDLDIPAGGGGNIRAKGTATLFDEGGVLLPKDQMHVDAHVVVKGVDAKENADILRLFLPEKPAEGVLDATLDAFYDGKSTKGAFDLHLRGVAVNAAVGKRSAMHGDDLTMSATWEWSPARIDLRDLKVRAEGLAIDGHVSGDPAALDGRIDLDADLGRMTSTLRTLGFPVTASLAGRAKGDVTFTPSPSRGTGKIALTGFRAEGLVEGRPPVAVETAEISFVVVPSGELLTLESFDVKLADLSAHASGTRRKDGALDLRADAKGDLGGLLARVRDLGFLPEGFSVAGTLDASVGVKGRPGATGADAIGLTIDRFVLTEDDVRIEAKGTASAGGDVDLTATGSGDLGKLLGRAQQAGAGAGTGPRLDAIRGRFQFDASAKGPASALVVKLPSFRLDGDLSVEASGEYRAGSGADAGALDAKLRLAGKIDDALVLARRLGFLDRELKLEGTIRADAVVAGSAKAPQVPNFTLNVASPSLTLDAVGSVSADRKVAATAKGSADLAKLADFAVGAKFVESLPPVRGRLAFDAEAAGSTADLAVPKFTATLREGPADVDVTGALTAVGRLTGSVRVDGALADLARFATDAGWLRKPLTPTGRVTLTAAFGGTKNRIHVPDAELKVTGPIELTAQGSLDAAEILKMKADFRGALQPLLDLAAQWTGGAARRVDGTIEGHLSAEGARDRPTVALPRFVVRAGGATLDANGLRDAQGEVTAEAAVRGSIPDFLNLLRAFDVANDAEGTGSLDATLGVRMSGRKVTGSAGAAVVDLVLTKPQFGSKGAGGGPFREPRAAFTLSNFTYDLDAGRLEPVRAVLQFEGAKLEATAELRENAGTAAAPIPAGTAMPPGTATPRVVSATGTLLVEETFVRNHPELFSDVTFQRVEGPFRFAGDVSQGRAAAAGWTGGAELSVTGLVGPHVVVDKAKAVATIRDGAVFVDPIDGTLNGGAVTGKAMIGLVGESPEHTLELKGKDVELGTDLAPLVARASPLFAVGEKGKTGGRASIDLRLAGRGLDSETIKQSLTGGGTLGFRDAFVESSDWVGMLLSIIGSSGRLDLAPVDVPFDVKNGRVKTGDVAMDGLGMLLRLGGEVGLDGKLEYALRVKPKSGAAGGAFEKYASFLDPDGFLPLRLEGRIAKPKLRAPDVKDLLKGKLEDLLGGLLGKDEKDEEEPDPKTPKSEPRKTGPTKTDGTKPDATKGDGTKGGGRKKKRDGQTPGDTTPDEPPPPPPPRNDEVPPPPPPRTPPAGAEEVPPPPPPAGRDEPPPPPPPAGQEDPPPPPPPAGKKT